MIAVWVRFWLERKPVRGSGALAKEKYLTGHIMMIRDWHSLTFSDRVKSRQTPSNQVELALAECPLRVPVQARGKYLAPIRNQLCRATDSGRPYKIVQRYGFRALGESLDLYLAIRKMASNPDLPSEIETVPPSTLYLTALSKRFRRIRRRYDSSA